MDHGEKLVHFVKNWLQQQTKLPSEYQILDVFTDHLSDFDGKTALRLKLSNFASHFSKFLQIYQQSKSVNNIQTKKQAGELLYNSMSSFHEEFFSQSTFSGPLVANVFFSTLKLLLSILVGFGTEIFSIEGGNMQKSDMTTAEPLIYRIQRLVQLIFGACVTDKGAEHNKSLFFQSKRILLLHLDSLRFRISLRIKQTNTPLETKRNFMEHKLIDINDYPVAERVTFRFYVARVELFNFSFHDALEDFEAAYKECSEKSSFKNKKSILKFLIFTKLSLGIYPKESLLQRFSLQDSIGKLTKAVKLGNVKQFDEYVKDNLINLSKLGILPLLHRTRKITFRNLLRRIFLAHPLNSPTRYQIKLPTIQSLCSKIGGFEITIEDLECQIVNLKNDGLISGYVHHPSQTLVLAKEKTEGTKLIKAFRDGPFTDIF